MAYQSWGKLNPQRDNAVLVLHALTGDAHVVGAAGPDQPTPGWWDGLIGPGAPLDTDELFALAAERAGRLPGHHRPVVGRTRTAGRTGPGSRRSPSATRSPPRSRWPTRSASTGSPRCSAARWAACGRWSGPSATRTGSAAAIAIATCAYFTRRPDRLERPATRGDPGRRRLPRRRLLRRTAAAGRDGGGPADRAHHLPVGTGTGHPVRPDGPGRRGPAARRPVRGAVLPGAPRPQARPPVRPELLPGADRGDELARHRPRPRRRRCCAATDLGRPDGRRRRFGPAVPAGPG